MLCTSCKKRISTSGQGGTGRQRFAGAFYKPCEAKGKEFTKESSLGWCVTVGWHLLNLTPTPSSRAASGTWGFSTEHPRHFPMQRSAGIFPSFLNFTSHSDGEGCFFFFFLTAIPFLFLYFIWLLPAGSSNFVAAHEF